MPNRFQKIIFSFVIFGLILSLFIFKPKPAVATDGGAGWMNAIKEYALDAVGWAITDQIIKPLKQKIIDWGMGKTTDSNEPFFVVDWKAFFQEIKDLASSRLIQEIGATKLCAPFDITIGNALTTSLNKFTLLNTDRSAFKTYAACTIDDIIDNADDFFQNPSIGIYGWDAWSILTKPNNNYLGMYYLMEEEEEELTEEETAAKEKETAVSEGVKNETTTTATDSDVCIANCKSKVPVTFECKKNADCTANGQGDVCDYGICVSNNSDLSKCFDSCETSTKGLALDTKVKNLGSTISTQMKEAMGSDLSRVINADEITELIGVFFSSVLSKAIDGLGLVPSNTGTTARDQNKDLYGYSSGIKKTITPEIKKDILTTVLNGTLKGVQMLSRATMKCKDEDTMVTDLDFNKNIVDIYSAQLEALYTGTTGANLKPDFEILDSAYAPFTLNGYRWANIPINKTPAKCKKVIDQSGLNSETNTCKDFISGLEPNYSSQCKQCLYDQNELNCPPEPYPPLSTVSGNTVTPKVLSETTILAKQDFYNKCQHWYGIATERCTDCIKKADAKCNQEDENQKQVCIESVCNNYEDLKTHVVSAITSGLDFYKKCLVEEAKNSCFTCLKEYFVPAEYCDTMSEYTARALIKYPAVVLRTYNDDGASIGRYDPTFAKQFDGATECDNDENANKPISLSLICRIMPDFKYAGRKICETDCLYGGMTAAQLADTTDGRPIDKDCNNKQLSIGGSIDVWRVIADGNYQQLTKCCAATNTSDYKKYSTCIGGSPETEQAKCSYLPDNITKEPWCYCKNMERPMAFTRTGWTYGGGFGGDCSDESFIGWKKGGDSKIPSISGRKLYMYTNNQPMPTDQYYIGTHSCSENDETWENASGWGIENGTQVASQSHYYISGEVTAPATAICTNKINNTKKTEFQCNNAIGLGGLHLGVYHTALLGLGITPSSTGVHICVSCNENDDGYPYYGYTDKNGNPVNQCQNKN